MSEGFQIETELSIHAVDRRLAIQDVPLSTGSTRRQRFKAEHRIGWHQGGHDAIGSLFKKYRPLKFFTLISLAFLIVGLALGLPVVSEFIKTGLVPRLPTALLATGLVFLSALFLATGLILDSVAKTERKQWELTVNREISRQ